MKNKKKRLEETKWAIKITFFAFLISLLFSFSSETIVSKTNIIVSIIVLLFFILLGVIFDVIGIAVTASDEKSFYSMAAKKIYGAKLAIKFKKNSAKVSSFCNDVIGDICGIMSGSAGATISLGISNAFKMNFFVTTLLVTSLIAALTIGGKALGKGVAVRKATSIHMDVARFLSLFTKNK